MTDPSTSPQTAADQTSDASLFDLDMGANSPGIIRGVVGHDLTISLARRLKPSQCPGSGNRQLASPCPAGIG